MDAYLQYVKNLQTRGYTTEQIQALLVRQGLDLTTLQKLLNEISNQSQQQPAPKKKEIRPDTALEVYLNYVKARLARGATQSDVDQDLIKRGVNSRTAAALIQMAIRPAPQYKQATNKRVTTTKTLSPTSSPQPADSDETLTQASEHLVEVADHLSEVADKLEAIEEGRHPLGSSSTTNRLAGSLTSADEAGHLSAVADHLSAVSGSLEAAEAQPRPTRTAAMQLLNRAQLAATTRLINLPVVSTTKPAPANTTSSTATVKRIGSTQLSVLVVGLFIYTIVFFQSLASHERTITWLALISMNVVGTVGFNIMLRRSSWQHLDQWLTATVLQTGLFLPFLVKEVVAPIHFPTYTPFDYLLLGCAVICLISLQFCNVKALEHLEASVYSVIYNSRIIFATLLGWVFLSEAVGLWGLIGGALIFMAIFIVRQTGGKSSTTRGILFGFGAAIAISAMNTCEKELIKLVGYEQYIFPMFTIAAIIMWAVVLIRRTKAPFDVLLHPRTALLMGLRAAAGISFSYSLVFGPVAVSSYLSSLSVILMVVCGLIFLGERDYIQSKIRATVVAIVGLTFILVDSLH